jgi:hypothetical protein
MLGSGAADYEARVRAASHEYGWFCRGHVGFSVPLSHKIIAGCDILIMPSRCAQSAGLLCYFSCIQVQLSPASCTSAIALCWGHLQQHSVICAELPDIWLNKHRSGDASGLMSSLVLLQV